MVSSKLGERLKNYIDNSGNSVNAISKNIGVSKQTIYNIIERSDIKFTLLSKILANYPDSWTVFFPNNEYQYHNEKYLLEDELVNYENTSTKDKKIKELEQERQLLFNLIQIPQNHHLHKIPQYHPHRQAHHSYSLDTKTS